MHLPANIREIMQDMAETESDTDDELVMPRTADNYIEVRWQGEEGIIWEMWRLTFC